MRALLRFSVRHPRVVLGAVGAISLSLGVFIPRVRLRLDARSLVPAGHVDLAASDAAASMFGLRDVVIIGIARKDSDIYNTETLSRIERLSRGLARTDGVVASSVKSLATTPGLFIKDDRVDVRPLLAGRGAEQIRRDVETLGLNDGVLAAADGKAAVIFGEIRPDADRYLLLRRVKELADAESLDDDAIYLSGTALAQAVLGRASAQDLMRLVPLVVFVLVIVLMIAFRRPAPAFISLAEIGVSLVWTVGLLGLSGRPVFVTTLVLPVILISVGVSDDVYVMKRYFNEARHATDKAVERRIFEVFGAMIWPIGLTTVSTIVGLLSLAATNLEPLRVFGIFGALAILFSALFTFSLVPALLVLVNPSARRKENAAEERREGGLSSLFYTLIAAGPRTLLAVTVVVAVCAILLTTRLRVDDSWIKNLPPASEVAQGDKALNHLLAGTTTLDLMVDSGQPRGFLQPQTFGALLTLEEKLGALPSVGASHGIYDDVLRLNASLRGLSYAEYRDSLLRGAIDINRGEIEQALLLLSVARRKPPGEWIDDEYRRARVAVFIRSADYQRIGEVLRVAAECRPSFQDGGAITPFGDAFVSYTTVRLLVEGQVYSISLALLTDLILLALLFKSVRASLLAVIPVAFSVLIVFAGLALTGTSLGIANSMFAGIAIGIGLDFAIHLTAAYRRERTGGLPPQEAVRRAFIGTCPAIVTSAGAIAVGFSVLSLSQIVPNRQLGLMICLSITVCALSTLVLIPSIVMARRSKA
ncbi:MAG TPA: MMPL family transporter [Pyrinomonadaceae bacterium]|nr:MMPL family transporter [Pyrinomonadaceae bacterium]